MKRKDYLKLALMVAIGLICVVHLDGDPAPLKQMDDIYDEGAWTHNARCKVLFGSYSVLPDNANYAFIVGPLFTFALRLMFGLGGVNLISARILGVLAFWGVLVLLYFLFKRAGFSSSKSLLPVAVLGLNHLALIQARWATPIFEEILFIFLSFTLLILGTENQSSRKQDRKYFLFGCGLFFAVAVAFKLSAFYMLFPWILNVGIFIWPMRRLKLRQTIPILVGLVGGGLSLSVFYLSNAALFKEALEAFLFKNSLSFFNQGIAFFSQGHPGSGGSEIIRQVVFNSGFANPMVFILMIGPVMVLGLRALQWFELAQRKKLAFRWDAVDPIEVIAFFWLLGGLLSLACFKDYHDRRYVIFLVPLTILFSKMVCLLESLQSQRAGAVLLRKRLVDYSRKAFIALAVGASFYYYAPPAENYANRVWFQPMGSQGVHIFENEWVYIGIVMGTAGVVLAFGYRAISFLILTLLIFVNLGLSLNWVFHSTFTLRDESRRLGKFIPTGSYGTGIVPWTFFFETQALPIFYIKKLHYQPINHEFPKAFMAGTHDLFVVQSGQNGEYDRSLDSYTLNSSDFPTLRSASIGDFLFAPFPGTKIYRLPIHVTHIFR